MNTTQMHLILTNQCTACCEICYLGCSPHHTDNMDETLLQSAIEQAKENECIESIHFTGGEPFLFYDFLKKGTLYAKEKGLKTSVDTNGFWGYLPEEEIHEKLLRLDSNTLNIYTSSYHRKFIPESYIENIVHTAVDVGLHVQLMIGESASNPDAGSFFQTMGDYKYLCTFQIYQFVPRRETLPDKNNSQMDRIGCEKPVMEIAVQYDGMVYDVSSGKGLDQPTGNLISERLEEIIKRGVL